MGERVIELLYLSFKLTVGSRELLATVPTLWSLIQFIMAFLFSSLLLISWQNFLRAATPGLFTSGELGWQKLVSCKVARVFPSLEEVMIHMFLGDQGLCPLFWEGDTIWANATIRAMELILDQELSCLASLGPVEQKTSQPVYVYSK